MLKKILLISLVFILGMVSTSVIPIEMPFANKTSERTSPHDWIKLNQIKAYNDRVVLEIEEPVLVAISETNSMDPVLDEYANAIEIYPKSTEDIHVGDIISYKSKYMENNIIHRVIEINEDEEGWYAVMKGDNLNKTDPERVRFEQIQRVVVAVVY